MGNRRSVGSAARGQATGTDVGFPPDPAQDAEDPSDHTSDESNGSEETAAGLIDRVHDELPRGALLDRQTFRQRHRFLCWTLALHLPALTIFGILRGSGGVEIALALTLPVICLVLAAVVPRARLAALSAASGLILSASALVLLSGGAIEAHFHFFVLIGFIALYQDWLPLVANVGFVVLSHGVGGAVATDAVYSHPAGQNNPWLWGLVHGLALLAASAGTLVFSRNMERVQERNTAMANDLAEAELATAQSDAARRQSESEMLMHLARRNQTLLDRQLDLVARLEQRNDGTEATSDVFKLDHLATRMRRNAESLLVLSGEEPARRWRHSVRLADVVQAAVAEIEDYGRVHVAVHDYVEIEGRVVADLAHLLAELVENATMFSSPTTDVRLRTYLPAEQDGAVSISIEDMGIGMPKEALASANQVLSEAPEIDRQWNALGFQVVSRLARRHGLRVQLTETPGGGITATVCIPDALVSQLHLAASSEALAVAEEAGAGTGEETGTDSSDGWRVVDFVTAAQMSVLPSQVADAGREDPAVSRTVDIFRRSGWRAPQERDAAALPGAPAAPAAPQVPGAPLPAPAPAAVPPDQPEAEPPAESPAAPDRAASSTMLSRFQAAQRAGRAVAETETGPKAPPEEDDADERADG